VLSEDGSQSQLAKCSVCVSKYLLDDGKDPREDDCVNMSYIIVKAV
jgi:hypothetical protein